MKKRTPIPSKIRGKYKRLGLQKQLNLAFNIILTPLLVGTIIAYFLFSGVIDALYKEDIERLIFVIGNNIEAEFKACEIVAQGNIDEEMIAWMMGEKDYYRPEKSGETEIMVIRKDLKVVGSSRTHELGLPGRIGIGKHLPDEFVRILNLMKTVTEKKRTVTSIVSESESFNQFSLITGVPVVKYREVLGVVIVRKPVTGRVLKKLKGRDAELKILLTNKKRKAVNDWKNEKRRESIRDEVTGEKIGELVLWKDDKKYLGALRQGRNVAFGIIVFTCILAMIMKDLIRNTIIVPLQNLAETDSDENSTKNEVYSIDRRFEELVTRIDRYQKEIISLTQQLLRVQEEERNRIAAEIHDTVLQELTAIQIKYPLIKEPLKRQAKALRQIIRNMKPSMEEGLRAALEDFVDQHHGIPVLLKIYGDTGGMNKGLELNILRIVQEAVTNAKKHSMADSISIYVIESWPFIRVRIEDDGIGFDETKVSRGMGLINIGDRVKAYRGNLAIDTGKGKGTSIAVEFKVRENLEKEKRYEKYSGGGGPPDCRCGHTGHGFVHGLSGSGDSG